MVSACRLSTLIISATLHRPDLALPDGKRPEARDLHLLAGLMPLGRFGPRSVGIAIQGRDAHVLVDRVRGVFAHVAVDPLPASVARHLAYAPKGVRLASPAPHANPVGFRPAVSPKRSRIHRNPSESSRASSTRQNLLIADYGTSTRRLLLT